MIYVTPLTCLLRLGPTWSWNLIAINLMLIADFLLASRENDPHIYNDQLAYEFFTLGNPFTTKLTKCQPQYAES